MIEDNELLRRYAEEKSDDGFAELVRRHIDFVHAAALRQARGNAPLAQDITQAVFADLARRAVPLARHPALVGWLHTATRFAAAKAIRAEVRRQARELEAGAMNEALGDAGTPAEWERLQPVLDEVLGELKERERTAILLRFFEKKPLAEVGERLALSETAARSCVDRALEKMRVQLVRRGVTSTGAALAAALANHTAVAAPAGLAAAVTGAALAGAGMAAGTAAGGGLIATFMSMTKLQIGISSALAVAGATGFALQARTNAALRGEVASLRQENAAIAPLQSENDKLARTAAEAADMRKDDAELKRLGDESAGLRTQLQRLAETRAAAAAPSGETYDVAKLDRIPTAKARTRPQYPAEMRKAGIGGEVTVEFIVDKEGNVVNAVAVKSSRREFEAAAVEAVSQWEFSPGQKGGRVVNTRMQVPLVFSMDKKEGTPGEATVKGGSK
jgi:RNA polymerase sigma factor (sigma-70 family)